MSPTSPKSSVFRTMLCYVILLSDWIQKAQEKNFGHKQKSLYPAIDLARTNNVDGTMLTKCHSF